MKKLLATLCMIGSVAALAACSTDGQGYKDEAPYASERTAGGDVMPAEHVFSSKQHK